MNSILPKIAIGAFAWALLSGVAVAQAIEEVKVQATRVISVTPSGRTFSGIPIKNVTLSYGVSLADLSLATSSGATEAARRIKDAAKAACEEIGQTHPTATPTDRECAAAAADQALTKLNQLVAAAQATPRR